MWPVTMMLYTLGPEPQLHKYRLILEIFLYTAASRPMSICLFRNAEMCALIKTLKVLKTVFIVLKCFVSLESPEFMINQPD